MNQEKINKLTLKELAPYLPYGLTGMIKSCIVTLDCLTIYSLQTTPSVHGFTYCSFCDFKPILRPLSHLTQEIEHNGEKFVPIVELLKILHKDKIKSCENSRYNEIEYSTEGYASAWFKIRAQLSIMVPNFEIEKQPYWLVKKLFEWHFDVFGLIEKGLAVSY